MGWYGSNVKQLNINCVLVYVYAYVRMHFHIIVGLGNVGAVGAGAPESFTSGGNAPTNQLLVIATPKLLHIMQQP